MNNVKIKTPKGVGEIKDIYVSELGFLMMKVDNQDGTYSTYNLGEHNVDSNIFTNKIIIYSVGG